MQKYSKNMISNKNFNKTMPILRYQWCRKGRASRGTRPVGRNSTLFAVILNVFLSRNLDQSKLKNAYFLRNCKNRLSIGDSTPEPPFASGGWAPTPPRCYFRLLLQLCQVCCF